MNHLLWHVLTRSAERHPDRPAVAGQDRVITYRDLEQESTAVAAFLASRGIGRGDRVAILAPKSIRTVSAMLGVSKSGAAYVPVDPHAPARRVAYILKDCAVRGLVTTSSKLSAIGDQFGELAAIDAILLTEDGPVSKPTMVLSEVLSWSAVQAHRETPWCPPPGVETDPAYLLYTSGSTGHPKGVVLSHRHALTFVNWATVAFSVQPDDRLSNHAPLHFDLSVFDLYVALRAGACVSIVPERVEAFPPELARWIEDDRITIWYSVPSAFVRLLLHGAPERFAYRSLRAALFAGEVFPVKHLQDMMARWPHASFYNLYGPTETNVCTYCEVRRDLPADAQSIPIGQACDNTEVFALDDASQRVGPGGTGELYVRGPSLMSGYWGDPKKTSQALVRNPLHAAFPDTVYRTGDLVHLDAGGHYWFVGRRDHMVKSRGYRIELGEIEQALSQHDGVNHVVVVPTPDDEIGARLHAVVVRRTSALTEKALQAFCATRLPRYMIPETIVFKEELPMTSTGKIDRVTLVRELAASHPQDTTS